jgi:hypothetical protein
LLQFFTPIYSEMRSGCCITTYNPRDAWGVCE